MNIFFFFFLLFAFGCHRGPSVDKQIEQFQAQQLAAIRSRSDKELVFSRSRTPLYEIEVFRQEMADRHPEWPFEIRKAIVDGRSVPGMTRQQLLASWGVPMGSSKSKTESGETEVLDYGETKVTLLNGILQADPPPEKK